MTVRILTGDVRARLADLPDASVQCVVTSPPYFGLRDYGTAQWDGGDAECDHKRQSDVSRASSGLDGATTTQGGAYAWGSECRKCGAVRVDAQIGLEPTLAEYIATLVAVFRDVRRVLRDDGTVWLNLGDSYAAGGSGGYSDKSTLSGFSNPTTKGRVMNGSAIQRKPSDGLKPKDLMMVPARVAIALQDDGWWLRSDIIWAKRNCMPESVTDRPTSSHEHIFLLTKQSRYYYDADAVREAYAPATFERINQATFNQQQGGPKDDQNGNRSPRRALVNLKVRMQPEQIEDRPDAYNPAGRNQRNVWTIATQGFLDAHFATFPSEIPRRCIKAGTSEKGQCSACGAPWVRVVERAETTGRTAINGNGNGELGSGARFGDSHAETTGWQPSCSCDADVVPQTVLDPFLGSGTTLLVADQLGRHGVGIELNPEYAEMARQRITNDSPMFAEVTTT